MTGECGFQAEAVAGIKGDPIAGSIQPRSVNLGMVDTRFGTVDGDKDGFGCYPLVFKLYLVTIPVVVSDKGILFIAPCRTGIVQVVLVFVGQEKVSVRSAQMNVIQRKMKFGRIKSLSSKPGEIPLVPFDKKHRVAAFSTPKNQIWGWHLVSELVLDGIP